jgi:hypothetical protein
MSVGVAIIGSGMSHHLYPRSKVDKIIGIFAREEHLVRHPALSFDLTTLTPVIACSPSSKGLPAEGYLFPIPQIRAGSRKRDYGR